MRCAATRMVLPGYLLDCIKADPSGSILYVAGAQSPAVPSAFPLQHQRPTPGVPLL